MSRWYQNVLSGKQVEVKTLEEDDFYQDNSANWARIPEPPVEPEPEPESDELTVEPTDQPEPKPEVKFVPKHHPRKK